VNIKENWQTVRDWDDLTLGLWRGPAIPFQLIHGQALCIDTTDVCQVFSGVAGCICVDSIDNFYATSFLYNATILHWIEFFQGQILGPQDLSITLYDSTYWGGTWQYDATYGTIYTDGTYGSRFFTPAEISYRIWNLDTKQLITYNDSVQYNSETGSYYVNVQLPFETGHYRVQWNYLRNLTDSPEIISQDFKIRYISKTPERSPILMGVYENLSGPGDRARSVEYINASGIPSPAHEEPIKYALDPSLINPYFNNGDPPQEDLLECKVFYQGQILGPRDLFITLYDSTYWGGSWINDETYGLIYDGTYGSLFYTPSNISYQIWDLDTTQLVSDNSSAPYNTETGSYYANIQLPFKTGNYQIQWSYVDSTGTGETIDQDFEIQYISDTQERG
jgi:uncharacterized protein involved in high-affinity Fe2+ transport